MGRGSDPLGLGPRHHGGGCRHQVGHEVSQASPLKWGTSGPSSKQWAMFGGVGRRVSRSGRTTLLVTSVSSSYTPSSKSFIMIFKKPTSLFRMYGEGTFLDNAFSGPHLFVSCQSYLPPAKPEDSTSRVESVGTALRDAAIDECLMTMDTSTYGG